MGLFGPSRQERAALALANEPITPQQNWRRHMKGTIPELGAVGADAVQRSGRDPRSVDCEAITRRAIQLFVMQMEKYGSGLANLTWSDLQIVINRPDFSMPLLSDYLSTCGATGVAVHNALVEKFVEGVPDTFAQAIREGKYDLRG
jgi:hypothetical protein